MILKLLHENNLRITKTKSRAKNIFYWPGMLNDVEQCIISCRVSDIFNYSSKWIELKTLNKTTSEIVG